MRILMVTTAFYPEQAIGSVRMTKLAKYLQAEGDELTIISLPPAPWSRHDEALRFAGLSEIDWTQVPQSRWFNQTLARTRKRVIGRRSALGSAVPASERTGAIRSVLAKVRGQLQFAFAFAKGLDWRSAVGRHASRHLVGQRFDAIFVGYPSFGAPFAGAVLKSMGLAPFLVVDFRDPVAYGRSGRFDARRVIERWMISVSDLAVFVSDGVRAKVLGSLGSAPLRTAVISNGYDPDDAPSKAYDGSGATDRLVTFCYVGAMYGGKRRLQTAFRAISEAVRLGGLERDYVRIHYAGAEGSEFAAQARCEGIDDLVVDHGVLTRSESIELQATSDVCLLATWNTDDDQGILTGKLFEYFMLRRRVLAIVSGTRAHSATKSVMEQVGAGFCFEEASGNASVEFEAMVEWLRSVMQSKFALGCVSDAYSREVEEFSYQIIVRRLRALLKDSLEAS